MSADRQHPVKKNRPFSSGAVSVLEGCFFIALLCFLGLSLSFFVNLAVFYYILAYAVLSVCYSLKLKKIPILDVMLLSFFFCWRVFVGGAALGISNNTWFLCAVAFMFLALVLENE